MNLNRKWAFACVLALGTAAGVAAVGCGDDSTSAVKTDAGGTDAAKTDSGPGVDSGNQNTTDGSVFDAGSVYDHLGGRAGIAAAVKETVEGANGELADPQIASYFAIRTGHTGSGGAPTAAIVEDCFTQLVSEAAGGPEVYAGYKSPNDAGDFACRSMIEAHTGLHISATAFSKFISITAAKLTAAGVASDDLMALGKALLGTQGDIVDGTRDPQQADAGIDGSTNYGARCSDIWDGGGDAAAPGCAVK
jgi:hypothetical protein